MKTNETDVQIETENLFLAKQRKLPRRLLGKRSSLLHTQHQDHVSYLWHVHRLQLVIAENETIRKLHHIYHCGHPCPIWNRVANLPAAIFIHSATTDSGRWVLACCHCFEIKSQVSVFIKIEPNFLRTNTLSSQVKLWSHGLKSKEL